LPIGPLKNAADANWQPIGANWQPIGADRFEEVNITIGEQLKSFCRLAPIGSWRLLAKSPICPPRFKSASN
jgi:hypothetical protein